MVKLRELVPVDRDGRVDAQRWLALLREEGPVDPDELAARAVTMVRALPAGDELLQTGIEFADLARTLRLDSASLAAALLYRPHRVGALSLEEIRQGVSADAAGLVGSVARMADSSLLEMSSSRMQSSEARDQVENIRRMLVSMIDDARVAMLKLAERVVALRAAKSAPEERKRRIAQEALQIFAPLANRLGVWHLKWELEDLALRYLEPDVYRALAKQLDGRRTERESQVTEIARSVEERLRAHGIDATVHGRAKHIFSIWKKMRAKNVGLNEVYDQRAIRVIVPTLGQCYSALGVIHTQWQHIPTEFDDYIAVPKENGYRSIHTAVVGDDGKTLEVQIRTPEMHEEAELGVCAHWIYKDGRREDDNYRRKMDWLRRVVEARSGPDQAGAENLGVELLQSIREERIFVYTPKGHVLDLTTGATPIDFAYRVHTEIGHRCRAARVDGEGVALNTPLKTGQRVEIVTGEQVEPRRDWLEGHLACVATSRAKEKIQEFFRSRSAVANEREGMKRLEAVLGRIGVVLPRPAQLQRHAANLGYADVQEFLRAIAVGECQSLQFVTELAGVSRGPAQLSLLPGFEGTLRERYAIDVSARNRDGLLLDITSVLKRAGASLQSDRGSVDPNTDLARISLTLSLSTLVELALIIDGLRMIPDVIDARRVELQSSLERDRFDV